MSFVKKHKRKLIFLPVAAFCAALIITASILVSIFGGFLTGIFHPFTFESVGGDLAVGEMLSQEIAAEGMVMLRNEDITINSITAPALPMPTTPMPHNPLVDMSQEEILGQWTPTPISVFGWGATNAGVVLGGSGSGDAMANANPDEVISIRNALTYNGFAYHEPTMNMMEGLLPDGRQTSALHSMVGDYPFYQGFWNLYEPTIAQYEAVMGGVTGAVAHSDTALIVLTRRAGEGADLLHHQTTWNNTGTPARSGASIPSNYTQNTDRTYLDLSEREEQLIQLVLNQDFNRVILMLNTANAMNLSFLEEMEGTNGSSIDAAFIMGFTGMTGGHGIAAMLSGYRTIRERARQRDAAGNPISNPDGGYFFIDGPVDEHGRPTYVYTMRQVEFSPSGRTVNTFVRDFRADPTFVNSSLPGTRRWAGSGTGPGREGQRFIEYMEGIYMGYWFFETARYEEASWGATGQFNYENAVKFPLGFGLSFTEFSWELYEVNHYRRVWPEGLLEPQDGTTLYTNSVIDIRVRVRNIGNRAGQDVVQAYFNAPFTAGGIEKPHVRLAAVAKTQVLQPQDLTSSVQVNHEEIVSLKFDLYDVASYDFMDRNNNGFAGFEFDAGDHNVFLQSNARYLASDDGSLVTWVGDEDSVITFVVPEGGLRYDYDITVRTYAYELNDGYYAGNESDIPRLVRTGEFQEIVRQHARNRFTRVTVGGRQYVPFANAALDGSDTGTPQTFMTRADFRNTFPHQRTPDRTAASLEDSARAKVNNLSFNQYVFELPAGHQRRPQGIAGEHRLFFPYLDEETGLYTVGPDIRNPNHELLMRLGANFNDPVWQEVLDQIPVGAPGPTGAASLNPYAGTGTLQAIVQRGGFQTTAVPSVGKPRMQDLDGPSGLNENMLGAAAGESIATAFPVSIVLAQTWNTDLAVQKGLAVAAEARAIGVSGWYAPGANIHRSPFGGRNFEYYSESATLSGFMAAYTVMGTNAGGLRAYIKHWAINEADQNRYMLNTFLTEQAAREIYLRSFEIAVRRGGANALMSSFNRVGTVWAGSNGALNINILREEWGFRGSIVTDFAQSTMINSSGLRGGNDIWLSGVGNSVSPAPGGMSMSSDMDYYVARRAAHNVLFTVANTYYLSQISEIELGEIAPTPTAPFPMWMIWGFMPIMIVLVAGLLASIFFAFKPQIMGLLKRNKQAPAPTAGTTGSGNNVNGNNNAFSNSSNVGGDTAVSDTSSDA